MEAKTNEEIVEEWVKQELEEVKSTEFDGDFKDSLKFAENKISEFDVDFSKPFQKWVDPLRGTVKKIIPVKQGGQDLVWWLNTKNPIYKEILNKFAKEQQTHFKVLQVGRQDKTQYKLVD